MSMDYFMTPEEAKVFWTINEVTDERPMDLVTNDIANETKYKDSSKNL